MSRGLGKVQRAVAGLMGGSIRRQVFTAGPLDTGELLQELVAGGFVSTEDRRQGLFVTRRACAALARRGLLRGKYVMCCEPPHSLTISWEAAGPESGEGAR